MNTEDLDQPYSELIYGEDYFFAEFVIPLADTDAGNDRPVVAMNAPKVENKAMPAK